MTAVAWQLAGVLRDIARELDEDKDEAGEARWSRDYGEALRAAAAELEGSSRE